MYSFKSESTGSHELMNKWSIRTNYHAYIHVRGFALACPRRKAFTIILRIFYGQVHESYFVYELEVREVAHRRATTDRGTCRTGFRWIPVLTGSTAPGRNKRDNSHLQGSPGAHHDIVIDLIKCCVIYKKLDN